MTYEIYTASIHGRTGNAHLYVYRTTETHRYLIAKFKSSELDDALEMIESFGAAIVDIVHNAIDVQRVCFY